MVSKRNDVSVKADATAIDIARKAASLKGKSLAQYLSEVIAASADRDLKAEAKKITKGDKSE